MSFRYSWFIFLLVPLVDCGMSVLSTNLSSLSSRMFERMGLTIPPCGTPLSVSLYRPLFRVACIEEFLHQPDKPSIVYLLTQRAEE